MKQFGNRVRYLVIVALDVAIMLLFHSYLNFILLIGLLVLPIYSVYGVYRVRDSFGLKLLTPLEPMGKGDEFTLRILLENPTWHPLLNATLKLEVENTFYREDGVHFLNFPVRGKKETEVRYPIVMDYSGRLCVNALSICFVDLLGLCELKVNVGVQGECIVLPQGTPCSKDAGRLYINGVTEAMESKEKGYDFSEISGIREYIPGDKLQNIHWKLSTKKDELMVKERVSVSAMQLYVLVELANDDRMGADAVLDLANGVTKALVMQNLPFTVYYYSSNFSELKSCYIGNEVERIQWLEMMLYDRCYREKGLVEDVFLKQYAGEGPYLYIGYGEETGNVEDVIYGEKNTVAELRGR